MTETEIRKLKQAVLERWEDTKSNIVVGLSHLAIKLRKELADKKYSSFDLSTSIPSIHRVKEEAQKNYSGAKMYYSEGELNTERKDLFSNAIKRVDKFLVNR